MHSKLPFFPLSGPPSGRQLLCLITGPECHYARVTPNKSRWILSWLGIGKGQQQSGFGQQMLTDKVLGPPIVESRLIEGYTHVYYKRKGFTF